MSRSGTSLTARILSLAGVYLGEEEELMQRELHQLHGQPESVLRNAREANPEGFWEHYDLMRLNERILRKLGGNWREPPDPEPGWERSAELAAERDEALDLLRRSFAGKPLWGWKDPRNSLTLPFWQELVPGLRYVVCVRNPLDVARSLEQRDGLELQRGIALWQTYLSRSLEHTSNRPRIVVPYERYFDEASELATRLARFADCPGAFLDEQAKASLASVVNLRLWRQRASISDEGILRQYVSPSTASLYEHVQQLAETS